MQREALAALLTRAEETHSDALVVRHYNQVVGEWYFGYEPEPIEAMSCTKPVVNLAVGALIDDGMITSLDQPVHDFYPEWKQGNKQRITIRHLLNHTSGLQNHPNAGLEIEPSPDVVQLALTADLADEPGSRFVYNNKAVNLLAGIVGRVTGQRLDCYLQERIFQPLRITEFHWLLDPSGTPYVMAGLRLHACDLAKIGQLMLNRGVWNRTRIISEHWVEASFRQGQPYYPLCGLLWWRVPDYEHLVIDDAKVVELRDAGVSDTFLQQLRPLVNNMFNNRSAYCQALAEVFGKEWSDVVTQEVSRKGLELSRRTIGDIIGFKADGWLGQYLVILPAPQIVAVRLIRKKSEYKTDTDQFADFVERVRALA